MKTKKIDYSRIFFFIALFLLYIVIFVMLNNTNLYNIVGEHNDRLFSSDDVYYVTEFFSDSIDDSPRIIKHPLLIVFGNLFTKAERLVFGNISLRSHYKLIVLMQICISVLASIYMDCIIREKYKVSTKKSLLFCAIFSLAFSTVFYTFVAESFIISALLLIMSYYYSYKQNTIICIILGVLSAGTTITNAFLWALIIIFSIKGEKKILSILVSAGILFCLTVLAFPIRTVFYSTIISGSINSANNFCDKFSFIECIVRAFFAFFCSTFYYIDTVNMNPFGDYKGDALSFIPSANIFVIIMAIIWLILIIWSVFKNIKNKALLAPLAVLAANIFLHCTLQYGLKEGFLYSLHHMPAQILIVSMLLSKDSGDKQKKVVTILCCVVVASIIVLNCFEYKDLFMFLMK